MTHSFEGTLCQTFKSEYNVFALTGLRDSDIFASGTTNGSITLSSVASGKLIRTLIGHTSWISCLRLLADDTLASGSWDKTIKLWNTQTGRLLKTLSGHSDFVRTLDEIASIGWLVSGSRDKTVKIWNLRQNGGDELLRTIELEDYVYSLSSLRNVVDDNDVAHLVVVLRKKLVILNVKTGQILRTLSGDSFLCLAVVFFSDRVKCVVAIGQIDAQITIWDVSSDEDGNVKCELWRTLEGHKVDVRCLVEMGKEGEGGGYLASGSGDGEIKIWNVMEDEGGKLLRTIDAHNSACISAMTVLNDGRLVSASSSLNGAEIKVWR